MTGLVRADVSHETSARFDEFARLVRRWNTRINLVGRSTLSDLWRRHFSDSAQLYQLAPHPVAHWVDLGSGAGFPGLVIAIMAMETASPSRVTLIESDTRKVAFLRTVIRETGAPATVICDRIEDLAPLDAEIVSARALAGLPELLGYAARHMWPDGTALFPKGKNWRDEVAKAQRTWNFRCHVARSGTEEESVVLKIRGLSCV